MRDFVKIIYAGAFALALTGNPAVAADDSALNTSTSDSGDFFSNFYFNYSATYRGPSIQDLGSRRAVDASTGRPSKTATVNLDGDTTAAYRITDTIGVGAYVPFMLIPVGQNFMIGDVGPKIYDSHISLMEGLTASANLMIQLPTSEYSKARKMDIAFKTTPSIRYSFANSNFTIGAANELKEYAGVVVGKTFKVWTLPYISYKLMKNLSLKLAYEMEWDHMANEKPLNLRTYTMDLQPGLVWNVTKTVMINPYVQFYSNNQLSADRTALGAFISASTL